MTQSEITATDYTKNASILSCFLDIDGEKHHECEERTQQKTTWRKNKLVKPQKSQAGTHIYEGHCHFAK